MKKLKNSLILVRPIMTEAKEEKIGSIIIPSTVRHKQKLLEGEVLMTGKGTPDEPMEVRVGDIILFKDNDNRIRVEDNVLMEQSEVLFIKEK